MNSINLNKSSNALNACRAECHFDLLAIFRSPGFVLPSLLFPFVFYIFFGILLNQGQSSIYLLVNYCIFGVMGPALFNFGMNVANEKEHGWLKLKQLSPMPAWTYLIAKTNTAMVFSVLICCGLFVIAAVGADIKLALSQWVLILSISLFGTLPFCLLGLLIGLSVSSKAAPAIVNLIYLPMAMLSGLWLPISMLPEFIQKTAWLLPSFHLSQLNLSVVGMGLGHSLYLHIAGVLAFTLPCTVLALAKFKRA